MILLSKEQRKTIQFFMLTAGSLSQFPSQPTALHAAAG
jgi:hypothetical protein